MKNRTPVMLALAAAFVLLMSLPFLLEGWGFLALLGFVPLLCMERIAAQTQIRRASCRERV